MMTIARVDGTDMEGYERHAAREAGRRLERFVGRYELERDVLLTVSRLGLQLRAKVADQPAFDIFAKAERDFVYKVVDAAISFHVGRRDVVTGLTLHNGGRSFFARRLGD